MIQAIFQNETTALESQIAALQAQIVSHSERIALLNDAEYVAGDSLESLKSAIQKVSSLAPSAVSNLRAAVLNLFTGNDSSNDGNDNEPDPAPQPDGKGEEVAIAVELLAGQSSPFASPFASPLACTIPAVAEPSYFDLVPVSDALAYFLNNKTGEIAATYAGFNNKLKAEQWGRFYTAHHNIADGFEVRNSKRMDAFKYELKLWGMTLDQIHNLAASDFTKAPTLEHTASHPVAEVESPLQGIDPEVDAAFTAELSNESPDPEAHTFQIGNKVKITSDRHSTLNQLGLITAATSAGAAVNVGGVMRWFCSDELELVEAAPQRRKPIDDLFETSTATTTGYSMNPIGRAGAQKNWEILQAKREMEREQKAAALAMTEPDF